MADVFISPLSTLISTEQIPESLSFISSGINALLDNVYCRDLKIQRSSSTSSVSYHLDIISPFILNVSPFILSVSAAF